MYRKYLFIISLKNIHIVTHSLFKKCIFFRELLNRINRVTVEDLKAIGSRYIAPLFQGSLLTHSSYITRLGSIMFIRIRILWVNNWPPGSGSLPFFKDLTKFQENV
jgi:hypothetical protein